MEIWVNPACSKCRAATAFLDEAGIDYTVRRYLDDRRRPILTATDGTTVVGRDTGALDTAVRAEH